MTPLAERRIRINVTCEGTLLALNESGAVVQLHRTPPPQTQTTLAIDDVDGTRYVAARILNSTPLSADSAHTDYRVELEFLR